FTQQLRLHPGRCDSKRSHEEAYEDQSKSEEDIEGDDTVAEVEDDEDYNTRYYKDLSLKGDGRSPDWRFESREMQYMANQDQLAHLVELHEQLQRRIRQLQLHQTSQQHQQHLSHSGDRLHDDPLFCSGNSDTYAASTTSGLVELQHSLSALQADIQRLSLQQHQMILAASSSTTALTAAIQTHVAKGVTSAVRKHYKQPPPHLSRPNPNQQMHPSQLQKMSQTSRQEVANTGANGENPQQSLILSNNQIGTPTNPLSRATWIDRPQLYDLPIWRSYDSADGEDDDEAEKINAVVAKGKMLGSIANDDSSESAWVQSEKDDWSRSGPPRHRRMPEVISSVTANKEGVEYEEDEVEEEGDEAEGSEEAEAGDEKSGRLKHRVEEPPTRRPITSPAVNSTSPPDQSGMTISVNT
ncbi:unnamed protein product, partial [Protopolystoma xenopodis]